MITMTVINACGGTGGKVCRLDYIIVALVDKTQAHLIAHVQRTYRPHDVL